MPCDALEIGNVGTVGFLARMPVFDVGVWRINKLRMTFNIETHEFHYF